MHRISFMPQNPIVRFWPWSYFKLLTVTKPCQSNNWHYGDVHKSALSSLQGELFSAAERGGSPTECYSLCLWES